MLQLQDELIKIERAIKEENLEDDEQNKMIQDELVSIKKALQEEKIVIPDMATLKKMRKRDLCDLTLTKNFKGGYGATKQVMIIFLSQFDTSDRFREEPEKRQLYKEISIQAGNRPSEEGYAPDFESEISMEGSDEPYKISVPKISPKELEEKYFTGDGYLKQLKKMQNHFLD